MHSKAFWVENSNFEFSWQTQLQSWLHVSYQIRVVVAEIAVGSPELAWTRLVGMYNRVKPEVAGHGSSSRSRMTAHLSFTL